MCLPTVGDEHFGEDSGLFFDDERFIIGRIKDLLIVYGRNHSPDDTEATIQEITGGRCAAIAVPDEGTEQRGWPSPTTTSPSCSTHSTPACRARVCGPVRLARPPTAQPQRSSTPLTRPRREPNRCVRSSVNPAARTTRSAPPSLRRRSSRCVRRPPAQLRPRFSHRIPANPNAKQQVNRSQPRQNPKREPSQVNQAV